MRMNENMKHHIPKSTLHYASWICTVAIGLFFSSSCSKRLQYPSFEDYEIALAWSDMALMITKRTPQNSPTFASRCLGYIGLTMYESVVHGFPPYQSLQSQLNEMPQLPTPDLEKTYNWSIACNAAMAEIIRKLYIQTSEDNKRSIDSLEHVIHTSLRDLSGDLEMTTRSAAFGRTIADSIFQWSVSDGGHRGYLANFDKNFIHPEHPGSWKPPLYAQSFSHHPLHPHWGLNRTFLRENSSLDLPYMIPYDPSPGSPYYEQFMTVYEKDKALSQ